MPGLGQINAVLLEKRATSGHSADINGYNASQLRLFVFVSAASGTAPTLDIRVEGRTRAGNYVTLANVPQITDASSQSVLVLIPGNYYRISWNIAGAGANFTFEVDAATVTV